MDGFLALGPVGEPLLLVRRPQHRLQEHELPFPVAFYKDIKEIPTILSQLGLGHYGAIGVELDVMPAALYRRLQEKLFPQRPILDLSNLIRRQRMLKSPYEIAQIRRAAHILDEALAGRRRQSSKPASLNLNWPQNWNTASGWPATRGWCAPAPGIWRCFSATCCPGLPAIRPPMWIPPAAAPASATGFPQGAGTKPLAPGEPISVDIAACVNGYIADETRLYVIGDLPPAAWQALDLVEKLYEIYETEARPGVMPGDLYQRLLAEVSAAGRRDQFMGLGKDQVAYLGHGVGLELDEFPIIGAKFPYPLAADMVIAFEPKFFLPDIGMVGFEDTGRITPDGVEWLTKGPRQVYRR